MKDQIERSLLTLTVGADGGFVATYRFASDLPVFAGHFPGAPIVPGVFLIESVRVGAERCRRVSLRIAAVAEAKFLAPVLPETVVEVAGALLPDGDDLRCDAIARAAGVIVAKLRLRLWYVPAMELPR